MESLSRLENNLEGLMRTSLLCLSLIAMCVPLSAQTLFLGLQAGGNLASASTSSELKHEVRSNPGFLVGFVAERKFRKDFAIRVEPTYTQKGAEVDAAYLGMTYCHLIRITSIDFPILGQYNILEGPLVPVVFLGPNFGFHQSEDDSYAPTKIGNTSVNSSTRSSMDMKEYCESFDLILEFGGGLEYLIGEKTHLFLNARYSYGLFNLVKKGFMSIDGTWHTSDVRIFGGVKIPVI
jgi:hypothetical protein